MSPPGFESAARAAGALAFAADGTEIRLRGDLDLLGLDASSLSLSDFIARLGPGDRALVEAGFAAESMDMRVRLIAGEGRVVYVRLLGRRNGSGEMEGLITPAGLTGADAAGRLAREQALTEGVKAGEVMAWYQPVIALEDGRLAGFEALARWRRPGYGVAGPDDFLDLANELGLIGEIGDRIRADAASDLSAWREAGAAGQDVFVAANATVSELVSPGFAARVIGAIDAAGLPARCYKLEIAETEIMRDPDRAAEAMAELSQAGVTLALDDFGTGYSSLARLDSLPFDIIKIDRYFVRAMEADDNAATVVRSVIQLAGHYGMKIVAEGVEDAEAAERLAEMGCHYAQGFRYAGALAPDAAAAAAKDGLDGRFLSSAR